jgi:hypothetical protein
MENLLGTSTDVKVAAVKGENTSNERDVNAGEGVLGISNAGCGVQGISTSGRGVVAKSDTDYALRAHSRASSGVRASSEMGVGVEGEGRGAAPGVVGTSISGTGVHGKGTGSGVVGEGETWHGVAGFSKSTTGGFGVYGEGVNAGVVGVSKTWHGVYGETPSTTGGAGVWGEHKGDGTGVVGISIGGVGVHGKGARLAGFFEGDVEVTGDIRLTNADCAEDFDVSGEDKVEPGTVMVLGNEGALSESHQAYDKRVAGVISGAGHYKPGIVLDKQQTSGNRQPIALMGKVFCKVDASHTPIEIGDLLTTSNTPGHAMKATDSSKAFGSVIGKALRPLKEGQGLIPILIALQ